MTNTQSIWHTLRQEDGRVLLARVRDCKSHWCKFRGLMLRASLPEDEGLLFSYPQPGIVETSIHMMFMRFAIAVLWLDADFKIVDKKLAKPWRPLYASEKPAQYVLEAPPAVLERVMIGEQLRLEPVSEDD